MGFFKKQLLEVIEWTDESKDTIVYRFPVTKREEIMNSSTLIVRPSQTAVFVHKGQICDVFSPGTYKLATENIPNCQSRSGVSPGLRQDFISNNY